MLLLSLASSLPPFLLSRSRFLSLCPYVSLYLSLSPSSPFLCSPSSLSRSLFFLLSFLLSRSSFLSFSLASLFLSILLPLFFCGFSFFISPSLSVCFFTCQLLASQNRSFLHFRVIFRFALLQERKTTPLCSSALSIVGSILHSKDGKREPIPQWLLDNGRYLLCCVYLYLYVSGDSPECGFYIYGRRKTARCASA